MEDEVLNLNEMKNSLSEMQNLDKNGFSFDPFWMIFIFIMFDWFEGYCD